MVTSARSENHENESCRVFRNPEMKFKSYQSQMMQNNSTQLLGFSFNNIYSKDGPQTPPDPKSGFFSDFLDLLREIPLFCVLGEPTSPFSSSLF